MESRAATASEPRKLRVLAVDDEPNVVILKQRILRKAGHQVFSATSFQEALNVFNSQDELDVIITDQNEGPGLKGDSFARLLRNDGFRGTILCITGHCETIEDHSVFDLILEKPVNPEELVRVVESVAIRH
jgi:CheY-like chemotaxis protein